MVRYRTPATRAVLRNESMRTRLPAAWELRATVGRLVVVMTFSFLMTSLLRSVGVGIAWTGFHLCHRDQRQADVAQLLQQSVQRGLVGDGTFAITVVPSVPAVSVSPSNHAAHRLSRRPLTRIS